MNCITFELWYDSHPFYQTEALAQSGVDISDPSKLSDGQWTAVCAQQKFLPPSMTPMVRPCSPEFASLLDAAKDRCETVDESSNSTELDKLVQKQLAQAKEAMCKSVGIMVRSSFP